MDCSPPGSSVHGILQVRIPEWVVIPFSKDLPDPEIEPRSPVPYADSFTIWATKKAPEVSAMYKYDSDYSFTLYAFSVLWCPKVLRSKYLLEIFWSVLSSSIKFVICVANFTHLLAIVYLLYMLFLWGAQNLNGASSLCHFYFRNRNLQFHIRKVYGIVLEKVLLVYQKGFTFCVTVIKLSK